VTIYRKGLQRTAKEITQDCKGPLGTATDCKELQRILNLLSLCCSCCTKEITIVVIIIVHTNDTWMVYLYCVTLNGANMPRYSVSENRPSVFGGGCSPYTDCTGQGNKLELIPNRARRGPIWSWAFVDLYRLGIIGAWSRKSLRSFAVFVMLLCSPLWSFAVLCSPLLSQAVVCSPLLCSFAVLCGPLQFFAAPCCPKQSFAVLCYAPLRSLFLIE